MELYIVNEITSYETKIKKYFTTLEKALLFIEKECDGINIINTPCKYNPFDRNWYYKIYYTDVQWAEKLFSLDNLGKAHFGHANKNGYMIKSYSINKEIID